MSVESQFICDIFAIVETRLCTRLLLIFDVPAKRSVFPSSLSPRRGRLGSGGNDPSYQAERANTPPGYPVSARNRSHSNSQRDCSVARLIHRIVAGTHCEKLAR